MSLDENPKKKEQKAHMEEPKGTQTCVPVSTPSSRLTSDPSIWTRPMGYEQQQTVSRCTGQPIERSTHGF